MRALVAEGCRGKQKEGGLGARQEEWGASGTDMGELGEEMRGRAGSEDGGWVDGWQRREQRERKGKAEEANIGKI